jgi:hypothetical protein
MVAAAIARAAPAAADLIFILVFLMIGSDVGLNGVPSLDTALE